MLKNLRNSIINWCLSKQTITIGEFHEFNNPRQELIDDEEGNSKFIEKTDISQYYVETDEGYSKIKNSYKTIKYKRWELILENGLFLHCADNHIVIDHCFKECFVKSLKVGDLVQTKRGVSAVELVQETDIFENMYDLELDDDRHLFYTNEILSHNTQTIAMYLLWYGMMADKDNPQTILIASKNNSHAIEIMDRIKYTYEELPMWLKPGVVVYNRHSITFDNGTVIKSESTTPKTGRGLAISKLYLDELAFINPRIQGELWASLAPTLSTGGDFIISSTPNGDSELFATLWRGANAGLNGFTPFQIEWHQHPERDDSYIKDMLGKLGDLKFRQEVMIEFLSSDSTLFDGVKMMNLQSTEPLYVDNDFNFWKRPRPGRENMYLVSVDPATGTGSDFSVIEVVEFPSLIQIAEFRSNKLNVPFLYAKVKWILDLLTSLDRGIRSEVFWTFERNGIGEALGAMYSVDETQNQWAELFSPDAGRLGCYTVNRSKVQAALQLKTLIERVKGGFKVNSSILIFEMKNFIVSAGSYQAKKGTTDDCISAFLGIARLMKHVSEFDHRAFEAVYNFDGDDDPIDSGGDGIRDDEAVPFAIGL